MVSSTPYVLWGVGGGGLGRMHKKVRSIGSLGSGLVRRSPMVSTKE